MKLHYGMLSTLGSARARTKQHRLRLDRAIATREAGEDEDAEDEEVKVDNNRQEQVVDQDNSRISHKDKFNDKQGISLIPATTVVASGMRPRIVPVNKASG